jgi:hypothetical protein
MLSYPPSFPLVMGAQLFLIRLWPPSCFAVETLETGEPAKREALSISMNAIID